MHRHLTQRRRQDARNAIVYWLDCKTLAERETSEDIRSSIEIDDDERLNGAGNSKRLVGCGPSAAAGSSFGSNTASRREE
jgi:hypothetical protein